MKSIFKRMVQISLVASTLFGVSVAQADQIRYMAKGSTAMAQIYDMLNSAQKSIDIATYIWVNDHTIGKMINAVILKKLKTIPGFKVRIIVDAYTHGGEEKEKLSTYFAAYGAELRYFNHTLAFDPSVNFRNHAKVIVVDGREYYTGGRNIADDYFSIQGGVNWIDRDVWVKGASARDMKAEFDMLWDSGFPRPYKKYVSQEALNEYVNKNMAWTAEDKQQIGYVAQNSKQLIAQAPTFQCADVEPQIDNPDFTNGLHGNRGGTYMNGTRMALKKTTNTVVNLVKDARKEIVIENYSYAPSGKFGSELAKQRENGLPIAIVTNLEIEGMLGFAKAKHETRDQGGAQIIISVTPKGKTNDRWAQTPKDSVSKDGKKDPVVWHVHSKVFMNEEDTFVSSWNIDPRSYHTNVESGVLVRSCPAFHKFVRSEVLKLAKINQQDQRSCKAKDCFEAPVIPFSDKLKAFLLHEFL